MKNTLWENLIKNIFILFLLILSYFSIESFIHTTVFLADKAVVGSILVAVSILAVTACFGNFAFTYEKTHIDKLPWRILAHFTTGALMFLIGLSLETTLFLSRVLIGDFPVFTLSLVILYIASVLYDFWDIARVNTN